MSLVVVAALALILGGVVAWLTRLGAQDQRERQAVLERRADAWMESFAAMGRRTDEMFAEYRAALLAHVEREAQAAREERQRLCDRIEAPGATAAIAWQQPEGTKSLSEADEEWLQGKQSEVPWDEDLALADSELES